jgi:hypothetical protein
MTVGLTVGLNFLLNFNGPQASHRSSQNTNSNAQWADSLPLVATLSSFMAYLINLVIRSRPARPIPVGPVPDQVLVDDDGEAIPLNYITGGDQVHRNPMSMESCE